jgi:hypothetical protein
VCLPVNDIILNLMYKNKSISVSFVKNMAKRRNILEKGKKTENVFRKIMKAEGAVRRGADVVK